MTFPLELGDGVEVCYRWRYAFGDDFVQEIIDWLVGEFKSENGGLDLSKTLALQG